MRTVRVMLDDPDIPEGPIEERLGKALIRGRDVQTNELVSFEVTLGTLSQFGWALEADGQFEVELP